MTDTGELESLRHRVQELEAAKPLPLDPMSEVITWRRVEDGLPEKDNGEATYLGKWTLIVKEHEIWRGGTCTLVKESRRDLVNRIGWRDDKLVSRDHTTFCELPITAWAPLPKGPSL